jgi:3-isopropylmalate/(R)-2-methylmalate dehydratase small subunit
VLEPAAIEQLFQDVLAKPGYRLTVDLVAQTVTTPSGQSHRFEIDAFRKHCLVNGLDDIGLTLKHVDEIRAYEARRRQEAPWLFGLGAGK